MFITLEQIMQVAPAMGAAAITGFFTWLIASRRSSNDLQSSLNTSFRLMIEQLHDEREEAKKEVAALSRQITELRSAIYRLQNHIQHLEAVLREHNIEFKPVEIKAGNI